MLLGTADLGKGCCSALFSHIVFFFRPDHSAGWYAGTQMEKEKRKRLPAMAPKQHVNKRGRSEKPAVTQGRRSKFTAMSAQTVTSDDEDAATCQRKK